MRFIHADEDEALFKGRLQLRKSGDDIITVFKGEPVGSIPVSDLKEALNAL
ncbi:hypothetical protein ACFQZI_04110 [Mucilaginibacter lutimaris]|uniref:Uncharacterized protein n=1 Tax=Mucilaginibacter lutimaris TaxID=931629 RepID=A0ABW2ZCV7_9SPHI